MDPDEEKVKHYLEERGFTVERFTKTETRIGKTPDFRVFRKGGFCSIARSNPALKIGGSANR